MRTRVRLLQLVLVLALVAAASALPPLVTPAEAAACHGFVSCPSPVSCGSWSSLFNCDSPFCDTHPSCDSKTPDGIAIVQLKERFRACTLANGSQCLEWELYSFKVRCGC